MIKEYYRLVFLTFGEKSSIWQCNKNRVTFLTFTVLELYSVNQIAI